MQRSLIRIVVMVALVLLVTTGRLHAQDANALNDSGWAAYLNGDFDKAIADFNRAYVQSGGNDSACIDTLAVAYAENGDVDRAVDWEMKAIGLMAREKDRQEVRERIELFKQKKPFREEAK